MAFRSYWVLVPPMCLMTVALGAAADRPVVFSDYRQQKPGVVHRITPADLPKPYDTKSSENGPTVVPRPDKAWPQTLPGFHVDLYAQGLVNPRLIRTAPNGDVFVAESGPGNVKVMRGVTADGKAQTVETFATGLRMPFGIAFYPLGPDPQWVYVGNTDSVVRFPYRNGDLKARGPAAVVVAKLPARRNHWTRDVAFSLDGQRMFVSVGSGSNVAEHGEEVEFERADVLEFTPEGGNRHVYASGIRNAVGIAVHPKTGDLWVSVNERDELGDNLVPDYITSVKEGGFYGWPWYYMGSNQDPRHAGKHPELRDKVIVPDVLLQPHNASLEMTFYDGRMFPPEYQGDVFAAEHGSWNRALRTGYEVIRVPVKNGKATGEYVDFLTGFVTPEGNVWGRPVGVAVLHDGSLLVSDDGGQVVWRVSYKK